MKTTKNKKRNRRLNGIDDSETETNNNPKPKKTKNNTWLLVGLGLAAGVGVVSAIVFNPHYQIVITKLDRQNKLFEGTIDGKKFGGQYMNGSWGTNKNFWTGERIQILHNRTTDKIDITVENRKNAVFSLKVLDQPVTEQLVAISI